MPLFVFVGTFIEEFFAPIPSLIVLIPAGVAAEVQGAGLVYLGGLALISGLGRVLGAAVVYLLADKFEDILLAKHRRLFGFSHEDVERVGERLSGTWRDWLVLFALNTLPFPPVLPIACGFLKVRFVMFAVTTFFGNIISASILLYGGYAGLQAVRAVFENLAFVGEIALLAAVAALLTWLFLRRKKRKKSKNDPSDV